MKKLFIYILFLTLPVAVSAQPSNLSKVAQCVFQISSYNANGDIIATSNGFFVNDNGDAVGNWQPFKGAYRAVAEDKSGRTYTIETIYGVNELYDVCKFHVNIKSSTVPIASKQLTKGMKVWVVNRNSATKTATIQSVESFFEHYNYYVLDASIPSEFNACPVVNQSGQVIGIAHASANGKTGSVTDINFGNSFQVTDALLANDPTMRSTNIRLAYPKDKQQALAVLLLASQRCDSLTRIAYIKDFIDKFPNEIEGYSSLAEEELKAQHFSTADNLIQRALTQVKHKDEAHAALAKLIYQKYAWFPDASYPSWTIDKGIQEAREAYIINALLPYKHQEAQLTFAKGDYQEAYNQFLQLTKTNLRSGELYYEAALCKRALQAPATDYIVLLDSAVQVESASSGAYLPPYLLARAQALANAENYRQAVADYNMYDSIMGGRPLYSDFYYQRSQCEMKIHQYQQALNDINRAILVNRSNYLLWAEKASLHLRFKQYDEALRSSDTCLLMDDKNTDAIIIKGIALCQLKRKKEGLAELEKARQLGDERAEQYIKKIK